MTITLLQGDCREILPTLPDCSVQMICTSPPYFGLRSYLPDGHDDKHMEMGAEASPAAYVANIVAVFREGKRVLRDDGTVWLNLGSSYASGDKRPSRSLQFERTPACSCGSCGICWSYLAIPLIQFKAKDLMDIPSLVSLALQADGWYLRSRIVWHKPNPYPENVTDRPTSAHEHVFLLTKTPRYFYDADAVAEKSAGANSHGANATSIPGRTDQKADRLQREWGSDTRNLRNVWTIATGSYSEAHFACVDEETECLTATGWKRHADLKPGMLAAQFDMTTERMSWAPIEALARYNVADQEMIVGSCRDLEMWLTPNHRTVIQRRHPRSRQIQPPTIIRADGLLASHSVPTTADWSYDGDALIPLEWAELLGWYVAEGHEGKYSLSVELYQSEAANGHKCRRIEDLLRQVGAEWTSASCKRHWRGRVADMTAYRISGYAAVRLRELAPGKKAPFAAVLWSEDRIAALLNGLIGGDGHTRPDDARRCFVQKDLEQCGLVQALAMRLGLSATVSVRKSDGIGVVYLTKHRTRSYRGTNGDGSPPTRRVYTGVVWCPKLPNGTWMARRNGKPFITGNTFPPELAERCIKAGSRPGDTILDPFSGAFTTALVADRLQRNAIGIELNPEYITMAKRRIQQDAGMFAQFAAE